MLILNNPASIRGWVIGLPLLSTHLSPFADRITGYYPSGSFRISLGLQMAKTHKQMVCVCVCVLDSLPKYWLSKHSCVISSYHHLLSLLLSLRMLQHKYSVRPNLQNKQSRTSVLGKPLQGWASFPANEWSIISSTGKGAARPSDRFGPEEVL